MRDQFIRLNAVQKIIILISLILFIISLTQPAFYIDRKDHDAYSNSAYLFFLGWMVIAIGYLKIFLIWLANPIYFYALFQLSQQNKVSIILSLAATLLGYSFSTLNEIVTSESGATSNITSF